MKTQDQTRTEQFKIDGDHLLAEFKRLLKEGNVRRISIKQVSRFAHLRLALRSAGFRR